jgi:hypothetical protein
MFRGVIKFHKRIAWFIIKAFEWGMRGFVMARLSIRLRRVKLFLIVRV